MIINDAHEGDSLLFHLSGLGITDLTQLVANLVSVSDQNNTATYTFVGGSTISLVGVSSDYIAHHLDLIKFS